MRLTSAMWLAVFMRNEQARGAMVSVVRRGAQEAGAIFVCALNKDRTADLYAPAPQSYASDVEDERRFEKILAAAPESEIDTYMKRQIDFDPDLWIIETVPGDDAISLRIVCMD